MRCGLSVSRLSCQPGRSTGVSYCWLLCVLCLLYLLSCSSACFIRNCPIGGKRAPHIGEVSAHRECLRCGPNGLGQCVGPNICCGKSVGCFLNTAETAVCRHENESPVPCRIEGAPCGPDGEARCVANGLCCTDERCTLAGECEAGADAFGSKRGNGGHERLSQDLLHYVHQLMASKGYTDRR